MRVTFICPDLRHGGAESQWAALLPGLKQHGLDIDVMTVSGEGPFTDDLRTAGIVVHCARLERRSQIARAARLLARIRRADVCVSRAVNANVLTAIGVLGTRIPHIVTEHSQYDLMPHRLRRRILTRAIAKRPAAVVAVAESQLAPLSRMGYPADRIRVIANGVEIAPDRSPRLRMEARGRLRIPGNSFVVAMVATLRPEKRILDFVRAIAAARTSDPRIIALVVGDGPMREAGEDLAAQIAPDSIRFVGSQSDVSMFLEAADVFCLSSASEAFPISVLEAMAKELPVVATDVGGVSAAVVHGVTGFLVPPGCPASLAARIVELAQGEALRSRFAASGRERQRKHFSVRTMVHSYATLIEEVGVWPAKTY